MANECFYCKPEIKETPFGYLIADLGSSLLYLFKDQLNAGRVILASKPHVGEYYDLPPEESAAFIADLARVSKAVHKLFGADKMNLFTMGDTSGHLHVHIVPKRKDVENWGRMFEMDSGKGRLTEDEYKKRCDEIRAALA